MKAVNLRHLIPDSACLVTLLRLEMATCTAIATGPCQGELFPYCLRFVFVHLCWTTPIHCGSLLLWTSLAGSRPQVCEAISSERVTYELRSNY